MMRNGKVRVGLKEFNFNLKNIFHFYFRTTRLLLLLYINFYIRELNGIIVVVMGTSHNCEKFYQY